MSETVSGTSEIITQFVEVILPVPIHKLFTYRVPLDFNSRVKKGQRVIVPFGSRKILTGVIAEIHEKPPVEYEARYLLEILDDTEVITQQQFSLYQWMAAYYLCSPGEVLNAALPSGLKLSSESMIQFHPSFDAETTAFSFSAKEQMLLQHLRQGTINYTEASQLVGTKSIYSLLKSLSSKEAIILFEEVREKYKPRTVKHVRLNENYLAKKALEKLFESIASKPQQEAVLLRYLQDIPVFHQPDLNKGGISKSALLDGDLSPSSLSTLIKNNILEEFEVIVPRFSLPEVAAPAPLLLSEKQEQARNEILKGLEESGTVLLHGVTGSGKTEIYIDLIRRALEGGGQVLYLLPEIALTTQIVLRLQKIFGHEMGIYHSKFSDNERVEVWNGILLGKFRFVVGVRSSVFLPFDNLGLIIVDEEHDSSYKQHEPAPRYHARDVALVMGQIHQAKILLGSATPSVESFYQASRKKYQLVTLTERFGDAQLPDIEFVNQLTERKHKTNKGEFSSRLLKEIHERLEAKEQVILFQNRRGYSPTVQCADCSWVPKCVNCAVSLTYHQFRHAMICHYCGYREELPAACPVCESKRILTIGYGTEKLEEEIKIHFPDAGVQRMDLDTTRTRSGYESIIESFEKGETNILIGTQMVTKGLDFDQVTLVGIFDADRMMHFPDFRSHERAFQLMTQVSGRAGRRGKKGKVIIQTFDPTNQLFNYVRAHNVTGFLQEQMQDRETHAFPPFVRLVEITVKHIDKKIAAAAALLYADAVNKKIPGVHVLGPQEPIVNRVRNTYLMRILIKIPRDQGRLGEIKSKLLELEGYLHAQKEFRQVTIVFDVDPI